MNKNGATVKLLGQNIGAQELRNLKAVSFDPVFGGQVDGRECRQSTVCYAAQDFVVVWVGDGAGGFIDLSSEEFIESGILGRIGLNLQFTPCQ